MKTENTYDLMEKGKLYATLKKDYDKLWIKNDQVLAKSLKAEIQRDKYRGALQLASSMLNNIPCSQKCDGTGTLPAGDQCQWCDEIDVIKQTLKNNSK